MFQPYFRQLQVDERNPSLAAVAGQRFVALSSFYGEVIVQARLQARAIFLGEREQMDHPAEGWLDRDITNAITTIQAKWKADTSKMVALSHVAPAITYFLQSLTMPSVETRWDRAARIAAEEAAKKKKAEAETQSEGS